MDDAAFMGVCNRFSQLPCQASGDWRVESLRRQGVCQVRPIQELHRDIWPGGVLADLVDAADAGMIQSRRVLGFANQLPGCASSVFAEYFDRDTLTGPDILGFVDLTL